MVTEEACATHSVPECATVVKHVPEQVDIFRVMKKTKIIRMRTNLRRRRARENVQVLVQVCQTVEEQACHQEQQCSSHTETVNNIIIIIIFMITIDFYCQL